MANFCHIAPIPHLDIVSGAPVHLLLAHLIETSDEYTEFYKKEKEKHKSCLILDNSAFEMYKQGRPMYDTTKLIAMAERVGADYVVMSDYPNEVSGKTIQAAEKIAPILKDAGFGTFFCPQSRIGDIGDLIDCFQWAASSRLVDYVGISILAIPNAYNVERGNKLQRFVSRFMFMQELHDHGILDEIKDHGKYIHMLGMLDGPNEIKLVEQYKGYIDTWDSSAAMWLGLHGGRRFDDSPTGLLDGKYEVEVDFDFVASQQNQLIAKENMGTINSLMELYLTPRIVSDWDSSI
ncbi:MAG: hypothetical protein EBZ49_01080 [Proteobacteria bacterium]|nr:hypothetical protein [Pseudomonadota bacterium]